jgi:hypothetical protein
MAPSDTGGRLLTDVWFDPFVSRDDRTRLLVSDFAGRVAEWQTRWLQVPVRATSWGFKSPLAHGKGAGLQTAAVGVHVWRELQGWGRKALAELRHGNPDVALAAYQAHDGFHHVRVRGGGHGARPGQPGAAGC